MITRINNTRGRRLLTPIDIATARMGGPEALVAWYDFTDSSTMGSVSSSGVSPPGIGDYVMRIDNKAHATAGAKALGSLAHQGDSTKCPLYLPGFKDGYVGGMGGHSRVYFFGDDYLEAVGSASVAATGKFSTTELDMSNFVVYVVCQRFIFSPLQREDVFFLTSKNHSNETPKQYCSFFFDEDEQGTFEMDDQDISSPAHNHAWVKYDDADDHDFRYHMFNAHDLYVNQDNWGSLLGGGLSRSGSASWDPDYWKVSGPGISCGTGCETGTLDTVMEFDASGTYHPSMTIGGQSKTGNQSGQGAKGTFRGLIYEIIIFNREHIGATILDKLVWGREENEIAEEMMYYLQRKYRTIELKS